MVGIICALPMELAPLRKRRPAGCRIVAAGMGEQAVESGARLLAKSEPLTALISAGFAGGLVREAIPGAIVVDARNSKLDTCLPPALRGKVLQVDHFVRTREERARIAAETGAVAVDMESETLARVAAELGLPFAAVRAITDGPDKDMVIDWSRFERPDGSLRALAALLAALRTPKGMAELRELWYASRVASNALSAFLADFLERWNGKPGAQSTT